MPNLVNEIGLQINLAGGEQEANNGAAGGQENNAGGQVAQAVQPGQNVAI